MDAYIKKSTQETQHKLKLEKKGRNGVRDFFIGAIAFVEFVCAALSAAYFETTDDAKWLLITLAVMSVSIICLVIMNIKEEYR